MVECEVCEDWFHFTCVGYGLPLDKLDEVDPDASFTCPNCIPVQSDNTVQSNPVKSVAEDSDEVNAKCTGDPVAVEHRSHIGSFPTVNDVQLEKANEFCSLDTEMVVVRELLVEFQHSV